MSKQNNHGLAVACILVVTLLLLLAFSFEVPSQPFQTSMANVGAVQAVGVAVNVTSIDWGILEPGQVVNRSILITNTGNMPNRLELSTSNYQPETVESYLALSWSYLNQTLQVNEAIPVTLSLCAAFSIVEILTNASFTFSFDITIRGF